MSLARSTIAPTIARYASIQCRHLATITSRRAILSTTLHTHTTQWSQRTSPSIRPSCTQQKRAYSVPDSPESNLYDFEKMKSISASPAPDQILIDVREPSELAEGYIPNAINLPIKSQPDALFLPEEEFLERYGFEKPSTDKELVIYCRAGVRASAAAQLAQQNGYHKVSEYRGSWLDWEKHGGPVQKP